MKVDVLLQNETIWLPQKKIAQLFDVQRPAITKHFKNIFDSGEYAHIPLSGCRRGRTTKSVQSTLNQSRLA